ncbi:MAG: LytR/AlgR family response regulator transcription factor [Bacteroidota bacterium]
MKVVIIEDEVLASERLKKMILAYDKSIEIVAQLESVEDSINWFENNEQPELIFLDIHLEDGLSFTIFENVKINSSIIFTTAFDEYAIKAFKLKSIDYLLKPIVQEELNAALKKFHDLKADSNADQELHKLYKLIVNNNASYKERFSVRVGQRIKTFATSDIGYFKSEGGFTTAYLYDGNSYYVDFSLDALLGELNPESFFRINRQMLVALNAIKDVHIYSSSRLKLNIIPKPEGDVLVSIDKTSSFKKWLGGNE